MLIKMHSIMTQKYCIEINVNLKTPPKLCSNKGTIKTNTMHKRCRQTHNLLMFFGFHRRAVENQNLFYMP